MRSFAGSDRTLGSITNSLSGWPSDAKLRVMGAGEGSKSASEVRRAVKATVERFGPDYWRDQDLHKAFPTEFFDTIGQAGYFGTFIPEEFGGANAGATVASVLVEEINRAGGDAACVNAQISICRTLVLHGSKEQKARYLPAVASGETRFLAVAATEPDSGAHMDQLSSTAKREGDDWIIDAQKVLISFAEQTRLMILLARAEEGTTLFLIDLDEVADEVEMHPIELVANRMTATLFIDSLRLPDSARLGPAGQGLACLMKGFAIRRVLAASESIGNARFLLDSSVEYAKTRKTRDRIIGEHQGVQYPLVQAYAKVEAADLMRWDALRLVEEGGDANPRSALAKILASEAAWETARAALTTFGGWGLARDYHVERKLREGTVYVFNNLLMNLVADKVLGLPRG